MEQRLELSLAIRDYTNQMREVIARIERMVIALTGMTESEQIALGEVLSAREVGELQAVAQLAHEFVADARAAAPTFLPAPVQEISDVSA
jgi:uncharacterized circularly permuted ATP-grasp superfamily protein